MISWPTSNQQGLDSLASLEGSTLAMSPLRRYTGQLKQHLHHGTLVDGHVIPPNHYLCKCPFGVFRSTISPWMPPSCFGFAHSEDRS